MYINELLLQKIIELITQINPTHILDLYAGAGNIGLALAKRGHKVTMMESAPTSIQDAQKSSTRNNINISIIKNRVENYTAGSIFFDLLILDPPRAGCGEKLLDFILTSPTHVLYISCNPHSLKKDTALLEKKGYHITNLIGFNMFPGTKHVETLCLLTKEI